MELKTWLSETPQTVGVCRYCGMRYANVPDDEGALPDNLLEEREILWGFRPLFLTLEGGHLSTAAGEWCDWRCFEADLSKYFELLAITRDLDRMLSEIRLQSGRDGAISLGPEVAS